MAVYTQISESEVQEHLAGHYALGELRELRGIAEGIENSNFLLITTQGKFILTLFEQRTEGKDLPYFIRLMEHLSRKGIRCPSPVLTRNQEALVMLKGKASVIVTFLEGRVFGIESEPGLPLMPELGALAARMHLGVADFPMHRENALSLVGWRGLLERIGMRAEDIERGLFALMADELAWLERHWPHDLPSGAIHADLFPDNVFFRWDDSGKAPQLTGVIDFYFACNDSFAYDLAIIINAWCFTQGSCELMPLHLRLLMESYQQVRRLSMEEKEALPILLRGAALRFLLTRAYDWLKPADDALVKRKDPMEYVRKLRFHQRVKEYEEYEI